MLSPAIAIRRRGQIAVANARRPTWGLRDDGEGIRVYGKIKPGSRAARGGTAVKDPAQWFERALVQGLARGGVAVDPQAPARSGVTHEHAAAIGPALVRSLKTSSNFAAEQTLRVLAAETASDGSLAAGRDAMERALGELVGALPQNVVLVDGSGLSKGNRLTPAVLVAVLRKTLTGPHGAFYRAALPVAAEDGSLEDRFRGTALVGRVRAKTGWIRGASSLSGLIEPAGGRHLMFSILMNYDPKVNGLNAKLKRLQEQMVAAAVKL